MLRETADKIRQLHTAGVPVPVADLLDAGVLVPSPAKMREARESAGLRQVDVMERLGVTCGGAGTVVSRWERGEYVPKSPTICTLASMYGREVRDLCEESAPGPSSGS